MIAKQAWWLVRVGLVVALAAAGGRAQDGGAGLRHVRVVWTTEPQRTATVSWTTDGPVADQAVVVAAARESLDAEAARRVAPTRSAAFSVRLQSAEPGAARDADGEQRWFHHARVDGLEPGTTVWFRVEVAGVAGRALWFDTAFDDDRPFALLSGGDSRSDPATRRRMNARIAALAAARRDVLALAHGGDYVANGVDLGEWLEWLDDHELTITADGRVLPVIPTRGNHEGFGPLYDEIFDQPGGAAAVDWFATRLSAEVLLVTLNSETAAGGEQLAFLEGALGSARDLRWTVVQYHRPLFPAVKSPGRAKKLWQPAFDTHAVDLVLESDGHVLKRTVPIRGDAEDPRGTVYIGEGGLGVRQRVPQTDRWFLATARAAHHVWIVDFGAEQIRLEAIGIDGEELDRAVIAARR